MPGSHTHVGFCTPARSSWTPGWAKVVISMQTSAWLRQQLVGVTLPSPEQKELLSFTPSSVQSSWGATALSKQPCYEGRSRDTTHPTTAAVGTSKAQSSYSLLAPTALAIFLHKGEPPPLNHHRLVSLKHNYQLLQPIEASLWPQPRGCQVDPINSSQYQQEGAKHLIKGL